MARKRASMREGPLAELFRATEAAQRQQKGQEAEPEQPEPQAHVEPLEETVEHAPPFEPVVDPPQQSEPDPEPEPEPEPAPRPDLRPVAELPLLGSVADSLVEGMFDSWERLVAMQRFLDKLSRAVSRLGPFRYDRSRTKDQVFAPTTAAPVSAAAIYQLLSRTSERSLV